MPEHNKERIEGETIDASDRRRYVKQLGELAAYDREIHGINSDPVIEGQIKSPIPVVDPMENTEDLVSHSKVINLSSLRAEDSAFGNRLQTVKARRKIEKKKAA